MKMASLSEKKIHKAGRIDQVVRDYFEKNKSVDEIPAKNLMKIFIEKGIFLKDQKDGKPIRDFLRELDAVVKLSLVKHVKVIRNDINRGWYFRR